MRCLTILSDIAFMIATMLASSLSQGWQLGLGDGRAEQAFDPNGSVLQCLFAEAVRRRARSMSNPGSLVIGCDEFGNVRHRQPDLSYKFLELGEHNIWFTRAWRSFGTVKLTSSMDFADEPEQANQFLACGHRFHKYCLDTFCSVSNTTLDNISCPLCHKSAAECREEADQLMSGCFGTALSRAHFNVFFP